MEKKNTGNTIAINRTTTVTTTGGTTQKVTTTTLSLMFAKGGAGVLTKIAFIASIIVATLLVAGVATGAIDHNLAQSIAEIIGKLL